mmetsp:Transcript_26640/g.47927  ORF Transcript_26640/g.47927 Transcript_26640/m.47927 type:complete len:231 (-) Transcript_26640:2495-3187(-)
MDFISDVPHFPLNLFSCILLALQVKLQPLYQAVFISCLFAQALHGLHLTFILSAKHLDVGLKSHDFLILRLQLPSDFVFFSIEDLHLLFKVFDLALVLVDAVVLAQSSLFQLLLGSLKVLYLLLLFLNRSLQLVNVSDSLEVAKLEFLVLLLVVLSFCSGVVHQVLQCLVGDGHLLHLVLEICPQFHDLLLMLVFLLPESLFVDHLELVCCLPSGLIFVLSLFQGSPELV